MFEKTKAYSGFAVDDVKQAREFYAEILGLKVSGEGEDVTLHIAGGRDTLVYPKPAAHMSGVDVAVSPPVGGAQIGSAGRCEAGLAALACDRLLWTSHWRQLGRKLDGMFAASGSCTQSWRSGSPSA